MTLATCTISGTVTAADGSAVAGTLVRVRLLESDSTGSVAAGATSQLTGSDGSWSVTVPQGASFHLEIPTTKVDHVGLVPSAVVAAFADVIGSMLPYGYDLAVPLDPTGLR